MFYAIRIIFLVLLISPLIFTIYKGNKLKKQRSVKGDNTEIPTNAIKIKKSYYVFSVIFCLILICLTGVFFYPFEKHFMTFASEKDAFAYICKDFSEYERYEQGDAIFYVERSKNADTIYSITKLGDRYSYVNNQSECTEYNEYNYRSARFDVSVMYNETANVSFYNVVVRDQPNPDNHNASLNDNNLAYAPSINKVWFNTQRKANCYYYMDTAEPKKEITVKVSNACATLKKPNLKHWLCVTYSDFSNSDD